MKGPMRCPSSLRFARPLIPAAIGLLVALPALGQPEHGHHRRGLGVPTAYQYGELDTVNLNSGNLSITIPITTISVGGDLSIPLVASYNSTVWLFEEGPGAG